MFIFFRGKAIDLVNLLIINFLSIFFAIFYFLIKDGLANGQSLGKKVMGITVIYLPTSMPCSMFQSFLRNIVIVILPIEPLVILISKERKGLGDYLAKTQVLYIF